MVKSKISKIKSKKKVKKVHMDDNKIDLSSVNKKTSKKLSLKNPFQKQKGPKRDEEGKFATTTGSGGLKAIKSLNLKRALPLILIVSLVGGLFVFRTFAGGSTSTVANWYRTCLGREGDAGGIAYWAGRLDKGEATWAVADAFMKSGNVTSCNKTVTAPTPTASTTVNNAQPAQKQATSVEPAAKKYHYGRSASPDCFSMSNCLALVNTTYTRLLGRNADESGKNHYASQMLDGGWTLSQLEGAIKGTAEYKNYQKKVSANAKSFTQNYNDVSVEEFVARAWQEATGWSGRPRDAGGGNKDRDQWVQMIKDGKMTRDQLLTMLYQSGAGGQHNVRRDDPNFIASQAKAKAASNAAYQLYMKLIAEKGLNKNNLPEPKDGLPYREDMCEAYVKYFEQGFDVHFGGAGSNGDCFRALGFNWSETYWEKLQTGEMSTAQIEQSMRSGSPTEKVVTCTERLAVVIPECGGGALTVSYDIVEAYKKQTPSTNQNTSSGNTQPSRPQTAAKPQQNTSPTANKQNQTVSNRVLQSTPPATPVALALASTPNVNVIGVPQELQDTAFVNTIIGKVSEIEQTVTESFLRSECYDVKDEFTRGAEDDCVSYVQEGLNLSGSDIPVTGKYNNETEVAVAKFQRERNIRTSKLGTVDSKTFYAIKKASEPTLHRSPYAPAKGSLVNNR